MYIIKYVLAYNYKNRTALVDFRRPNARTKTVNLNLGHWTENTSSSRSVFT